jgi:hypothetical protein
VSTQETELMGLREKALQGVHATRRQFPLQTMERQVRHLVDPLHNEGAVRFQRPLATPAHLDRRDRAGLPITLRPFHHRRDVLAAIGAALVATVLTLRLPRPLLCRLLFKVARAAVAAAGAILEDDRRRRREAGARKP